MKKSLASILALAMILSCMTGLFTFTVSADTTAVTEISEETEAVVSNFNLTPASGTETSVAPEKEETTTVLLGGNTNDWHANLSAGDEFGIHFSTQGGALYSGNIGIIFGKNELSDVCVVKLYKWSGDVATTKNDDNLVGTYSSASASNNAKNVAISFLDENGNPLPAGEYYASFNYETFYPGGAAVEGGERWDAATSVGKDTTGYLKGFYKNGSVYSVRPLMFDITVGPKAENTVVDFLPSTTEITGSTKFAAHVNTNGQLLTGYAYYAHSYAADINCTIKVYPWNGSRDASIAGEAIYEAAFVHSMHTNPGYTTINFDNVLPAGEYCILIESDKNLGLNRDTASSLTEEIAKYIIDVDYYQKGWGSTEGVVKSQLFLADSVSSFYSASVTVGDDYAINFKVSADDIHVAATYEIVLTGENGLSLTYGTAADALTPVTDANGTYIFTFDKIGPHQMGNIIKAELRAYDINGNLIGSDSVEYSIKQYCENKIATSKDAKLVTMLKDMLNYGAAAQKYVDPDVANADLVNNGMDTTTSTTTSTYTDESFAHTPAGNIGFTTVSVRLNNGVEIILKTVNTDNNVVVGDETLIKENGVYVHRISLLSLTQAYTYTVEGATLTYSLPIYIARRQSSADANLSALLTELMKFGASLNAWNSAM